MNHEMFFLCSLILWNSVIGRFSVKSILEVVVNVPPSVIMSTGEFWSDMSKRSYLFFFWWINLNFVRTAPLVHLLSPPHVPDNISKIVHVATWTLLTTQLYRRACSVMRWGFALWTADTDCFLTAGKVSGLTHQCCVELFINQTLLEPAALLPSLLHKPKFNLKKKTMAVFPPDWGLYLPQLQLEQVFIWGRLVFWTGLFLNSLYLIVYIFDKYIWLYLSITLSCFLVVSHFIATKCSLAGT